MILESRIEKITRLRRQGMSVRDIARRVGTSKTTVSKLCKAHSIRKGSAGRLERMHQAVKDKKIRIGRSSLVYLTEQEFSQLMVLAEKWGCENLSEAMAEIAKDYLQESIGA